MSGTETAIAIGSFVTGLVALYLTITARVNATFVRKDVDAVEKKALTDSLNEIKQLVTDTKNVVTTEMPKAIQRACIVGVDAGVRLQNKRTARLPVSAAGQTEEDDSL